MSKVATETFLVYIFISFFKLKKKHEIKQISTFFHLNSIVGVMLKVAGGL